MEEEATKAAAINCQPCNPSCNTPSFTGCAFVDALHMVLSRSNSPRNMTKTKHALQLQRKDPPLTSLPKYWDEDTPFGMHHCVSTCVSITWIDVCGTGRSQDMSVPRCPHWPCAEGWDDPLRIPSLACAASEGGSLVVSPTMVTPFFLCPPHICQGRRASGRDGGNLFPHLGVVWLFSLSPPTSFSTKQY